MLLLHETEKLRVFETWSLRQGLIKHGIRVFCEIFLGFVDRDKGNKDEISTDKAMDDGRTPMNYSLALIRELV